MNKNKDLKFTGERVVVDKMEHRPDILTEHMARYNFASDFVKDLVVLDAACGSGFGKEVLKAQRYYGVDVSQEAVEYARAKYGDPDDGRRSSFEEYFTYDLEMSHPMDSHSLAYQLPRLDAIVSFETIEHLEDPNPFLKWVSENCKMFVFSIPVNMPSEFHKQVYSIEEIKALISKHFPHVYFYGQVGEIISADLIGVAQYVVGVAFTKLPKISIVIPTLGREAGLQRCLDSIADLNYPEDLIETIVIEDHPVRMGVPLRLKEGVERSTGEYIVYGSNDIRFTNNSLFIAALDLTRNNKRFLSFNTGEVLPDEGNICEHFIIHRDLVEELGGEIFDTEFHHVGVDNLLWAKVKKLGEANRCAEAVVEHFHFSRTGDEMDEVYKLAWDEEKVREDRELLKVKLEALNK